MKRVSENLLICIALAVMTVGCGASDSKSDHTHLWTAGEQQHVWSYERVKTAQIQGADVEEPKAFLKREIQAGETVVLDGGATIQYDGTELRVGKQLIKAKNVHVERNGSVRLNAFIRSSQ